MFDLSGRVAVVTGGSSGIGEAICCRFGKAGATVVNLDRVAPREYDFPCIQADVSHEAELSGALEEVVTTHGALHILVNTAGIQPLGVGFDDLTSALLRRTFEVNVDGVALGIKHAARLMESGGRILNCASFVGTIGVPGGTAYAASKAAVAHLTRCAAVELAPRNITVNAVAPGTVRTPAVTGIPDNPEIPFVERRTPLGRLAEPDEIAGVFHFLASGEASYVTGAVIPADGGITAGWERYDLVPPAEIEDGRWNDDL